MKISIFTDNHQVGKTQTGTQHPRKGSISTVPFGTLTAFKHILEDLTPHQFFTVGLYPGGYQYVPSQDVESLTKPKHIAKTKANATPGHMFIIDCDHPKFAGLKGPALHQFLEEHLPDLFAGTGYITTRSSSFYTKGAEKFHQYYFFKNPSDMSNLYTLVDRLFKHHNMITYRQASNYSRSLIDTPIDRKLRELQQPVFEMSGPRLQALGIDKRLEIDVFEGNFIEVSALSLPNPHLPNVETNYNIVKEQAERERREWLQTYGAEHGLSTQAITSLERGILDPTMEMVANIQGEKISKIRTTLMQQVERAIRESKLPFETYQAVGEENYAQNQTAKMYYDGGPFQLNQYRLRDQAHGGTTYIPVFNYDQLFELLELAKEHLKDPRQFSGIITAKSTLTLQEIEILAKMFAGKCGISPGKLVSFMKKNANEDFEELQELQDSIGEINPNDLATILASIEGNTQIDITEAQKEQLKRGMDVEKLFRYENVEILREIVYSLGGDIVTKPGPLNQFNIATKRQTVKNLAQTYPLTTLSPKANEITMDAMIEKFTATKNIDKITYRASLHGETLYFSDNAMEITYQQPKPTFQNVSEPTKYTLDNMSQGQENELREIYMKESIGDIWASISELMYIKKVYPELKKDFLWLHLASDVGKTFNMDIANIIAPFEKTSLDQLMEQASKVVPSNIAKSSFLFHDEVKHFKHAWNELGHMHSIKPMHSNAVNTQLPLKILASAEDTMSKGTQQQLNRLMVYKSKATKPFREIIDPKYWNAMGAIAHQVVYEQFTETYNKYARLPQNEAKQKAIITSSSLAAQLAPKDMMITQDVVKEAIVGYLLQEYINPGNDKVKLLDTDPGLARYVKLAASKNHILYVNFKKIDAPAFIEYVLRATTSSIESRAMNYEALSITWDDLGAYNLEKPKTIGGQSGFYGQVLEINIPQGLV